MNPDRAKNLPSSGKQFGQLKQRQASELDSICAEFAAVREDISKHLREIDQPIIEFALENDHFERSGS